MSLKEDNVMLLFLNKPCFTALLPVQVCTTFSTNSITYFSNHLDKRKIVTENLKPKPAF